MKRTITIGGIALVGSAAVAAYAYNRRRLCSDPCEMAKTLNDTSVIRTALSQPSSSRGNSGSGVFDTEDEGVDLVDSNVATKTKSKKEQRPQLSQSCSEEITDGVAKLQSALQSHQQKQAENGSDPPDPRTTPLDPVSGGGSSGKKSTKAVNNAPQQQHQSQLKSVAFKDETQVEKMTKLVEKLDASSATNGLAPSPSESQDSGKGPSPKSNGTAADTATATTNTSTTNGGVAANGMVLDGPPPFYEFEIPQSIVGLVIGTRGETIKSLQRDSCTTIWIRQHPYRDNAKLCYIEGTREQINGCLRLIRKKFPVSRFPELKLTPYIPPPVSTPIIDNTIQYLNLPEGVKVEVLLSSVVSPAHFFLQQPTHPSFPSLARLDQYMLAVYSQPAGIPDLPKPLEAGVICAAPIQGGWYRAQIMDVFVESGEVVLKYVDYGGYSKMGSSLLKQIRSDFMTLPFQATECYLDHVDSLDVDDQNWSAESLAYFEQLSRGKIIEAKQNSLATDLVPVVELFVDCGGMSFEIHQLLVDEGYARFRQTHISPKPKN